MLSVDVQYKFAAGTEQRLHGETTSLGSATSGHLARSQHSVFSITENITPRIKSWAGLCQHRWLLMH